MLLFRDIRSRLNLDGGLRQAIQATRYGLAKERLYISQTEDDSIFPLASKDARVSDRRAIIESSGIYGTSTLLTY